MRIIETVLKQIAESTDGVEHYGRGAKAYSNIESIAYPRIWVHRINPVDTIHQNGLIVTEYNIVGEVSTKVDYASDIANNIGATEFYLNTLENLQLIFYRFIHSLNKHPKNKSAIGIVKRNEFVHEYDDNLCGYVFSFNMKIEETISYQC
jgi:hypothetical protein